jgi:hypothetical protein
MQDPYSITTSIRQTQKTCSSYSCPPAILPDLRPPVNKNLHVNRAVQLPVFGSYTTRLISGIDVPMDIFYMRVFQLLQ